MTVVLCFKGACFAGGLHDFLDSWPIDSGTTRRILLENHKSSIFHRGFLAQAGQGRLFEMPELDQRFVALAGDLPFGFMKMYLAGDWGRLGSRLFVEDRISGHLFFGGNQTWGVSARWRRQTLGDQSEEPTIHFGLLWETKFKVQEVHGRFSVVWPLNSWAANPGDGRRETIFNLTLVESNLALAMVVDRHAEGHPLLGIHLLLPFDGGVGLEFRADPSTGGLGPGLSFVRGSLMVRSSHLIHPHLGVTHRLMLVVGRFGGEG